MPHPLAARLARLERTAATTARGCDDCRAGVGPACVWARHDGPDEAPSPRRCNACGRVAPPRTVRVVRSPTPAPGAPAPGAPVPPGGKGIPCVETRRPVR